MKLEKQVVSFDLARRLKELGVKQESYFYWCINQNAANGGLPLYYTIQDSKRLNNSFYFPTDQISAFTCAELGEMLPDYFNSGKHDNEWTCRALAPISSYVQAETEANCRAKMLIYLIENGLNDFFSKKDKFILDKDKNVISATLMEWAEYLENSHEKRVVKKDEINVLRVSTVFLGIDHNFNMFESENHEPHIFETLIFKSDNREIYCARYATWKQAEEGHQKAIDWINDGCKEDEDE